ncbi:MAG: magnesium transporter CorA family protein, partial [Bryobacteraceae bacterium]
DRLAERYHLHPLHIEDCRHRNQSAKVEENGSYLFVVLKPIELDAKGELSIVDLDLFLGSDYLITVQETECSAVRKIIDYAHLVAAGMRPDQLFYRITDAVVDSYLPILDYYHNLIDNLEDEVLEAPEPKALAKIFEAKRGLIVLRRVLVNMRDVSGHLQRSDNTLIGRDMWPFLRDIYDHLARNLDMVEMQRDLLTGALDIYLSSLANRTNQTMKVLTILSTIALPALLISSFYGMNVKGLPWADSAHGTWIALAIMAATTAVLLGILKRFRWW